MTYRRLLRLWVVGLVCLSLVVGMAGGVLLDRQVLTNMVPSDTIPANATANFRLIAQAWNTIQQKYVDRTAVQARWLTYGAISGMVDALGDTGHSVFLTPQMVQEEREFTQGQFQGIGAEVRSKDGYVVIVTPMDDSPAQKAGLRPNDIIRKVNGEDIMGLPLEQVVAKIKGPVGSKVTLTIEDPRSGQMRDVTLVRAKITIRSVSWHFLPGTKIAHVRISAFSQGTTKDLEKALTDIQKQGAQGLILDLRNNPGGLLPEAVGVASQFLKSGNVLLEKNAQGQTHPVAVEPGGTMTEIPMVVLVNSGTASAAEIVTGALQDAHRTTVVGETTFGTGTVLNRFPLSDGSALMLATEEWLTPNGHVIWHRGIAPDRVIALPVSTMPLFPEAEREMTPTQLRASSDAQLLGALDQLKF